MQSEMSSINVTADIAWGFLTCPPSTAAAAHSREHEAVKLGPGLDSVRSDGLLSGQLLDPGGSIFQQASVCAV